MTSWNSAIFGCGLGNCCKACCCFPCLVSSNSARLDGNPDTCFCTYPTIWTCCCVGSAAAKNRAQAKARFGFGAPNCEDACYLCFCLCCSEMQVAGELDFRGITTTTPYMSAGTASGVAPTGQAMST